MPRPSKFTEDKILEAASQIVATDGPSAATITAIAAAIGAPSGSIYHRFRVRDELLGRLWLTKATFFQNAFSEALDHPDPRQAAVGAALSMPQCVRADFRGARIMLLYRREDFLGDGWPKEMTDEADRLGNQVSTALGSFTLRLFGSNDKTALLKTAIAIVDVPFGAVRRFVDANEIPPPEVDDLIAAATLAIVDRYLAGPLN